MLRRPLPQLTHGEIPEIPIAGKIVRRALLKNTEKSGAIVNDWIPLPGLALELHAQYGQRGPGYTRTYRLAADGVLPTVRDRNRLFVERSRLPEVATLLGVMPRTSDIV